MSTTLPQPESRPSIPLPECDFPDSCRDLYPKDFRYPEGYLASRHRVTDAATLLTFEEWMRPYVVQNSDKEPVVDHNAPVPVRRLARGPLDTTIKSAIRFLEWEGPADESLQATFSMEDLAEEADLWSEAGQHERAVSIVRKLPPPFQATAPALRALVRSLTSLARYEEALVEVEKLISAEGITDYARDLYRIQKAELLLHCGQASAAEALLDKGRNTLQSKWTYFGARAALALHAGDEGLAKSLVLRAGRVDAYHAYKLLWNRHLEPLADFIRRELLTEDGKPRLYERNSDMRRLTHAIHGALLTGRTEHARNLAEGLQMHFVTDWDSGEQLILALAGLGYFEWLEAAASVIPGRGLAPFKLAQAIARCALKPGSHDTEQLLTLMRESGISEECWDDFESLLPWLIHGKLDVPIELTQSIVADVGVHCWTDQGRDRYVVVYDATEGFQAQKVFQDRSVIRPSVFSLRKHFPVIERIKFDGAREFEAWLESKIQEDVPYRHPYLRKWDMELDGWSMSKLLNPDSEKTPLVAEAVSIMQNDPSLYFSNGPGAAFSLHIHFGDKMMHMLRCWLSTDRAKVKV